MRSCFRYMLPYLRSTLFRVVASDLTQPLALDVFGVRFMSNSARTSSRFAKKAQPESQQGENQDEPDQLFDEKDINAKFSKKEDMEAVLKIVQRFEKNPETWPQDELPFGVCESTFVGKVMSKEEIRPIRAFANIVPIGTMSFRHMYRMFMARVYYAGFKDTGVFEFDTLSEGCRQAFEVVSQAIYKNDLPSLVDRNVCLPATVARFEAAGAHMSDRQRAILNLTHDDIIGISPGVLGPFQRMQQFARDGNVYLGYSMLCCALYKKQMLYDAVKDVPSLKEDDFKPEHRLAIPANYGYKAPRLVMGYLTFAHKVTGKGQLDSDLSLADFQYIVA